MNGSTKGLEEFGVALCGDEHRDNFAKMMQILLNPVTPWDFARPTGNLTICGHNVSHKGRPQRPINGYLDGEPVIISHPDLLNCDINIRVINRIIYQNFGNRFNGLSPSIDKERAIYFLSDVNATQQDRIDKLESELAEVKGVLNDLMNLMRMSASAECIPQIASEPIAH